MVSKKSQKRKVVSRKTTKKRPIMKKKTSRKKSKKRRVVKKKSSRKKSKKVIMRGGGGDQATKHFNIFNSLICFKCKNIIKVDELYFKSKHLDDKIYYHDSCYSNIQ
uniref:Uncharacterized protein n=1 Tax=viral metagenome TaxID=1070528 RepID=A0A6C0EGX7_9ZZZZ